MAKSVKTLSVYVNLNSKEFTKGLTRLGRRLQRLGNQLQSMGKSMTRNITMPLTAAGAGAIKLASDFNESMTKIQTLVGTSGDEVEKLKQKVLDLAGETAQAPKDLAEGLFFIQSAGFKGQEGLDALEVSAKGAAIGMGELKDIANATTSIMTAYKDQNMTAAQAGDLLHETLKQGKFDAAEFMNKIGQVLPTAAAFGISFEQLGAAVATMSKVSGDAAGSLTAVNQLMMQLKKPSEQQKEILDKIFGSYDNLNRELQDNFMGTLEKIFTGLEGNDEALVKVFGSARAVKAAFATVGLQGETFRQVLDGMYKSTGNVDEGFAVVSQDSAFKFKKALADLKVAAIQLGTQIMPIATKIADAISKLAKKFNDLDSEGKKNVIMVGALAMGAGPLLTVLGGVVKVVGKLTKALSGLILRLAALSAPVLIAVGLFAALLTAAGYAAYHIYKDWDNAKIKIAEFANAIITAYNEILLFKVAVESLGFVFSSLWELMLGGIRQVGINWFAVKETLWSVTRGDINSLSSGLMLWESLTTSNMKKVFGNIADDFETALDNVKTRELALITPEDIQEYADKGKEIAGNVIQGMKDTFQGAKDLVSGFIFGEGDGGDGGDSPEREKIQIIKIEPRGLETTDYQLEIPPPLTEKATETFNLWSENTLKKFQDTYNQMAQTVKDFTLNFADSFADMVATTITEGGNMAENFGRFLQQMIKDIGAAIIKMAVLKAIMTALGMPAGAGTAVSSVIGNVAGFSSGGIVTSPVMGLVGEGRNINANNPEIIAPLSDLKKYIGGGSNRLHGEIMGSNILLSNTRSTNTQNRVGGSSTDF